MYLVNEELLIVGSTLHNFSIIKSFLRRHLRNKEKRFGEIDIYIEIHAYNLVSSPSYLREFRNISPFVKMALSIQLIPVNSILDTFGR